MGGEELGRDEAAGLVEPEDDLVGAGRVGDARRSTGSVSRSWASEVERVAGESSRRRPVQAATARATRSEGSGEGFGLTWVPGRERPGAVPSTRLGEWRPKPDRKPIFGNPVLDERAYCPRKSSGPSRPAPRAEPPGDARRRSPSPDRSSAAPTMEEPRGVPGSVADVPRLQRVVRVLVRRAAVLRQQGPHQRSAAVSRPAVPRRSARGAPARADRASTTRRSATAAAARRWSRSSRATTARSTAAPASTR